MKCKGCYIQSEGIDLYGNPILYCVGSPEDSPKYGSEKVITTERIILTMNTPVYRANDEDECHLWSSERFEKSE